MPPDERFDSSLLLTLKRESRMKTMPTEFRKYKADFKLLKREGRVCLYSREAYGETDYEVVIAQVAAKDWVKDGVVLVSAGDESYPSSEQWGSKGWTYSKGCHEMAEKRFDEQVAKAKLALV
jgi:hypothetical protein